MLPFSVFLLHVVNAYLPAFLKLGLSYTFPVHSPLVFTEQLLSAKRCTKKFQKIFSLIFIPIF